MDHIGTALHMLHVYSFGPRILPGQTLGLGLYN